MWYLSKRGIEMGVYHHGWVDDAEIIGNDDTTLVGYKKNTLFHWHNFTESKITSLMKWGEYMESQPTSKVGTKWRQCIDAKGSKYGS